MKIYFWPENKKTPASIQRQKFNFHGSTLSSYANANAYENSLKSTNIP